MLTQLAVRWRWIEAFIGIVFCWLISACALCVLVFFSFVPLLLLTDSDSATARRYAPGAPLAVLLCVINATLFPTTLRALRRGGQFGIEAAKLNPRWPGYIIPWASIWWLALFLLGVFFAASLQTSAYLTEEDIKRFPLAVSNHRWVDTVQIFVGTFGIVFAGNTFLMLAVSEFTRNERVLRTVWQFRVPIDLAVSTFPAWLAATGRFG
ncbi:MAG TPA: hypothetical protein VF595_08475 [Tepidisphaeraceae bacterium]|jgi:hypothetical protein